MNEVLSDLYLDTAAVNAYGEELRRREYSTATVEQYLRSLRRVRSFLGGRPVADSVLREWKAQITAAYSARTVNCMVAAVNGWLDFVGRAQWKLKVLKCQHQTFLENELTEEDFRSLLRQAKRQDEETAMLLTAMSSTGVRVSEVAFLTVEAVRLRMAVVRLKGKTRRIPLGESLCRALLRFARERKISSGPIFRSKTGRPLDRRRIWEQLKALCGKSGVDPKRVRPHALRHLFARSFYAMTRDIAKLADILGHSSIDTTRIYVATTCTEHRILLEKLSRKLILPQNAKRPPLTGGRT